MGLDSSTSAAGANALSFLGSTMKGGGVSRESIRPIASMAPPSIWVRSSIVAEADMDGVREGDREGREGSSRRLSGVVSGECTVLTIVGKSLELDALLCMVSTLRVVSMLPRGEYLRGQPGGHCRITHNARKVLRGGGSGLRPELTSRLSGEAEPDRAYFAGLSMSFSPPNIAFRAKPDAAAGSVVLLPLPRSVSSRSSTTWPKSDCQAGADCGWSVSAAEPVSGEERVS